MDYLSDILSNFQLKTVHVDPGMTLNSFYFNFDFFSDLSSAKFRSEKLSTVSLFYSSAFLVSILQKTAESSNLTLKPKLMMR
jgi:hypothetical protein